MNRTKLIALVLAGAAVLLALFFAARYGARPYSNPVLRSAPFAGAMAEIKFEKKPDTLRRIAGPKKKVAVPKPGKKRKKRVSPLRDPGEAIIGQSSADTDAAAAVAPVEKK